MTFTELELRVVDWADARGILDSSDPKSQFLKTVAEMGELADALNKGDRLAIKDGFGDVLVTLILAAELCGTQLEECLELAYNEIAKRKGKMVNGVFVKD